MIGDRVITIRGEDNIITFDAALNDYIAADNSIAETHTPKDVTEQLTTFIREQLGSAHENENEGILTVT